MIRTRQQKEKERDVVSTRVCKRGTVVTGRERERDRKKAAVRDEERRGFESLDKCGRDLKAVL